MNESTESPEEEIRQAYVWGKTAGLCDGLARISKAESAKTVPHFDLFIFEYSDGTVTWVEKDRRDGMFRTYPLTRKMSRSQAASWAGKYENPRVVASVGAEELGAVNKSSPAAEPDIIGELPNRDDIPNYVKDYLNEWDREGGTWNLPRGWSLDKLVADIKRIRKIKVTTYTGKSGPGIDIPTNAVPLKVTPRQIEDYVRRV